MANPPLIKQLWRGLRSSQPFNRIATGLGRVLIPPGGFKDQIIEHLPFVGMVNFRLPNGRSIQFKSYGDDYILNKIFWTRQYEPELSGIFIQLAEKSRCIIDAGAHVGFYAMLAAAAHPENRVFAFEPLEKIYRRLAENAQMNRLGGIETIHSALGREEGSIEFFHIDSPYLPSNSGTLKQKFLDSGQDFARSLVPLTTIDRFCEKKNISRVDLIKMDTEGTELDVLHGAEGILQRDRPTILCEVLESLADVQGLESFLRPLGYRFYRLEEKGPVPLERIQGSVDWRNFLFTIKTWDELRSILRIPGSAAR